MTNLVALHYSYRLVPLFLICTAIFLSNSVGTENVFAEEDSQVLFEADFEEADTPWGTLPDGWWFEGEQSGAQARVLDGHLTLDSDSTEQRQGTLWLDRELPADVEVSFDVHVVASRVNANNMNLFLGFRDQNGKPLPSTQSERSESGYDLYHSDHLTGTIITFLPTGPEQEARVRVRQVPPFNPVLEEYKGYHARAGQTYHIDVLRRGDRLKFSVDGKVLVDTRLPNKSNIEPGGYLGFRTWRTNLWWDNLVVRSVEEKDALNR